MNLKKFSAVVLSASMMMTLASCGKNAVVLTAGDVTMTRGAFETYYSLSKQQGIEDTEQAKEKAKEQASDRLSLLALMSKMGLEFSADDEKQMQEQLASMKEAYGGEKGYKEFLDSMGVDEAFMENDIKAYYAQMKIFGQDITDEALETYFNENYLRAKHVLVSTMDTTTGQEYDEAKIKEQTALAEDILNRAKSGEDFDTLVAEYSEDPGSQSQPDGYFFTAGEMMPEFENGTRELELNGIGMAKTSYGYHIIKRLPLDDNEELYNRQFSMVKEAVKNNLIAQRAEAELESLLEENGIEVTVNEKVYEKIK